MARVKRGTKRRARRKKFLKRTKGFFLTKSKLYQSAQEAVNRAERFSYRDRRVRKRQFRTLWIQRIGAAARNAGISYSQLMHGLKAAGVEIDRKILSDIAVKDAARIHAAGRAGQGFARRKSQGVARRFQWRGFSRDVGHARADPDLQRSTAQLQLERLAHGPIQFRPED